MGHFDTAISSADEDSWSRGGNWGPSSAKLRSIVSCRSLGICKLEMKTVDGAMSGSIALMDTLAV